VGTADRLAAVIREIPSVSSKLGTFVGRDGSRVVVSLAGARVVLPFVGSQLPPVGASVQVESRDGVSVVTGAAAPLPQVAKVTALAGTSVTVEAWGSPYTLRYLSSYIPVVGDEVSVSWGADGGVVQDKLSRSAPVPPPAAYAGTGALADFHPGAFTATGSGSYGSQWFTNDVYASSSNTGGWWYGSKVRDTIPDNAQVKSASIFLNPRQVAGSAPVLRLHTSESQPSGPLSFTAAPQTLNGARTGWVPIPLAWVDFLKSNAGGVGFEHGGYSIFRGTQSDQLSGALDISWAA
jgi:hypothetical protein